MRCRLSWIRAEGAKRTLTDLGIDICDLLDGASFSGSAMPGRHDTSICALAQFFHEFVLGIHHEGGIQGGETVSLHNSNRWIVVGQVSVE
jgi:hypothetical protein